MNPEVDWVVLAKHAEAVQGHMNLAGAGFYNLQTPPTEEGQVPMVHIGIGVCLVVPWTHTNQKFPLHLSIVSEDGRELFTAEAEVEAGRAPGMKHGEDSRAYMAVNTILPMPPPGGYRVLARFAKHTRSAPFRVHPPGRGLQVA
jgi:hypothetical protein